MVVIEVFTPVVQRILKHNMVSSPDTRAAKPGETDASWSAFPKIWGWGWLASQPGLGVGILSELGFSCSLVSLAMSFFY